MCSIPAPAPFISDGFSLWVLRPSLRCLSVDVLTEITCFPPFHLVFFSLHSISFLSRAFSSFICAVSLCFLILVAALCSFAHIKRPAMAPSLGRWPYAVGVPWAQWRSPPGHRCGGPGRVPAVVVCSPAVAKPRLLLARQWVALALGPTGCGNWPRPVL